MLELDEHDLETLLRENSVQVDGEVIQTTSEEVQIALEEVMG